MSRSISSFVPSPGFPQARYVAVAETLQREITEGKYPLGAKLPPERELAKLFGVAGMTIRQAIGLLEKKGLLLRRHGHGTFVQSAVDGLLIGVIFGVSLNEESADFYRAAAKAITEEIIGRGWQYRLYDPGAYVAPAEAPRFPKFQIDLRNYTFHGLVRFAMNPQDEVSFGKLPGLPPCISFGTLGDVSLDDYHFGKSVVEYLAQRNCQKIAYLRPGLREGSVVHGNDVAGVIETAQRLGLPTPALNNILDEGTVATGGMAIYEATRRLIASWSNEGGEQPDALIIKDDIAMHAVAVALIQSGIRVPEDLVVVCGSNDMAPQPYGLDLVRYLYPIRALASTLIGLLEKRLHHLPDHAPLAICGSIESPVLPSSAHVG